MKFGAKFGDTILKKHGEPWSIPRVLKTGKLRIVWSEGKGRARRDLFSKSSRVLGLWKVAEVYREHGISQPTYNN